MRNAIPRIQNDTSGTTRSIEGQYGLNGNVEGGSVERFKHDLSHFLPVGLWIERSLGEENGVFVGCDAELVVECVVPDFLHVVPVGDYSVFDGVLEGKDATLGLGSSLEVINEFSNSVRKPIRHTQRKSPSETCRS